MATESTRAAQLPSQGELTQKGPFSVTIATEEKIFCRTPAIARPS
jgi:hypothetical protein